MSIPDKCPECGAEMKCMGHSHSATPLGCAVDLHTAIYECNGWQYTLEVHDGHPAHTEHFCPAAVTKERDEAVAMIRRIAGVACYLFFDDGKFRHDGCKLVNQYGECGLVRDDITDVGDDCYTTSEGRRPDCPLARFLQ